jgi:lysine-N-methylase
VAAIFAKLCIIFVSGAMAVGKKLSMQDVEELSWRYAREIEHSDDNLNALEDWLFGM